MHMDHIVKAQDLFDLSGEVALITGASSGLGRRFAKVLAAHGAAVILAARREERIESLKEEINNSGGKALAISFDAQETGSHGKLFEHGNSPFGPVSILINNAGIARTGPALEMSEEDWRTVIEVNLNAVWFLAQEAGRRMADSKNKGTIINIGSILGLRVDKGSAAYNVSKAGVIHMTRTLAVELARYGIRVNAIAPGYIMSEMTRAFLTSAAGRKEVETIPQRRYGDPSDLDGAILFLASRKASGFMTGSTVVVDGGHMWSFG